MAKELGQPKLIYSFFPSLIYPSGKYFMSPSQVPEGILGEVNKIHIISAHSEHTIW